MYCLSLLVLLSYACICFIILSSRLCWCKMQINIILILLCSELYYLLKSFPANLYLICLIKVSPQHTSPITTPHPSPTHLPATSQEAPSSHPISQGTTARARQEPGKGPAGTPTEKGHRMGHGMGHGKVHGNQRPQCESAVLGPPRSLAKNAPADLCF